MKRMRKETVSDHPMEDFPVRSLEFGFDNIQFKDPLWSRSRPEFSMFINALGVHVPHFERYLVKTLSMAKKHVDDETLRRDMGAIIGQEAHHAKNFLHFNRYLSQRYPKIAKYDKEASEYFISRGRTDSMKRLVGFTAGYETFTFLSGIIILDNYEKWMGRGDPVMKALWVWHQVEEVEHGAVAFDVYKHLYGEHEWYRKWMILAALSHIAMETIKCYLHMSRVEGFLRTPWRALKSVGFCGYLLSRLLYSALPVFRKDYHPKNHRLVTNAQNPIQIAWRRYENAGGDVLAIDRQKMADMLKVAKAA